MERLRNICLEEFVCRSLLCVAKSKAAVKGIASQYKGRSREAAHRQATAAIATMVGAILLARATNDPLLSDRILTSGRRAVLDPAGRKTRRRSARVTGENRQAARWRQPDSGAIQR
jgi:hypothetical protein